MWRDKTSSYHRFPFILIIIAIFGARRSVSKEITVALNIDFYPNLAPNAWSFESTGSALPMAIEDFQNQGWLQDITFRYIRAAEFCSPKTATLELARLYYTERPDVLFGFGCSSALLEMGLYASYWNLPIFCYGGVHALLGNKDRFDGLIRIHPSGDKVAYAFVDLARRYNWRRVAMVSSEDFCDLTGAAIRKLLDEDGVLVTDFIQATSARVEDYHLNDYLDRVRERARIILFCMDDPGSNLRFLQSAYNKGMYPGFVFIKFGSLLSRDVSEPWIHDQDRTEKKIRKWQEMLLKLNYKVATYAKPTGPHIDEFLQQIPIRLARDPWYFNLSLINGWTGSYKAVDVYDLAITYMTVLNETLAEGKGWEYVRNGTYFQSRVKGKTITGLRGKFRYDHLADRIPNLWVWSMSPGQEKLEEVAIIKMAEDPGERYDYINNRSVYWDTMDGQPPPDTPACGFQGEFCQEETETTLLLVGLLTGGLVVVLIAGILGYLYKKKRDGDALRHMLWKIDFQDIVKKKMGSVAAISQNAMEKSFRSVLSEEAGNEDVGLRKQGHAFTEVGVYRGITVTIIRSEKTSIELSHMDLMELKAMHDMSHDNVVTFVGACIQPPNICYFMMYCQKGSLQDIIENDDVTLDWTFKASLLSDMCNGLSYIHKSVLGSHGSLKSSCCLVDSRWQLKISSYGLHAFRSENSDNVGDHEKYSKQLWTAPELLRQQNKPRYGTKKGDIYSYGIITHEIVYKTSTFGIHELTAEEIVKKVECGMKEPYRPVLGKLEEDVHPDVKDLMRKCWEEDPEKRLSCDSISQHLIEMNQGREVDIMETMIQKLEKYANNLEEIVSHRTAEIVSEKRKTDILLYRMLPESVAEQLKQGKLVPAELYDEVTVYFSDIVGFTALSLTSSPIEVVDLLNDLYSMFDDMISLHDVYKVETIGDSYMVVSGLPHRNGNRHVGEIANLALDLMSATVTKFKIRHKPEMTLQLRIGFHTGSCAAGVVGLSMPRFCLFGDTVNMASRMETNGKALRIHLSNSACTALRSLGDYVITTRGEMQIKGKGLQSTYWLTGKKGFSKPLPDSQEWL